MVVNAEAGYSAEKHTSTSIFDRELKSPTVGKYELLFSDFFNTAQTVFLFI
jgi:hypothetical protein